MKKNQLALILAIIAGLICLSNFIYKLMKFGNADFVVLFAGIFIIALGISSHFKKKSWLLVTCAIVIFPVYKEIRPEN